MAAKLEICHLASVDVMNYDQISVEIKLEAK